MKVTFSSADHGRLAVDAAVQPQVGRAPRASSPGSSCRLRRPGRGRPTAARRTSRAAPGCPRARRSCGCRRRGCPSGRGGRVSRPSERSSWAEEGLPAGQVEREASGQQVGVRGLLLGEEPGQLLGGQVGQRSCGLGGGLAHGHHRSRAPPGGATRLPVLLLVPVLLRRGTAGGARTGSVRLCAGQPRRLSVWCLRAMLWHARMTPEGTSSTGRASVSKTEGWGFKSLVPCENEQRTSTATGRRKP